MKMIENIAVLWAAFSVFTIFSIDGATDPQDVSALGGMFSSLNSPSQLTGWSSNGGDPCGQDWKGIKCSGSSVKEIKLRGLGLSGSMGYQLSSLTYVTNFDLSKNNLQGNIPYELPPNALHINLAGNSFSGSIPYSISHLTKIQYLNLSHNQLSGQLSDMFGKLRNYQLDLSFNNFQGNLPQSLGSLSNLDTLHLQDNGFTGSVNVLASLPLVDLNIENNHFSGSIPGKLKGIKKIKSQGNSFSPGLASRSSNTSTSHNQRKNGEKHPGIHNLPSENQKVTKESDVSKRAIAGIVIAVLATIVLLLVLFSRKSKSRYLNEEKLSQNRSFISLATHEFRDIGADDVSSPIRMKTMQTSLSMGLKPPSLDKHGSFNDNAFARESSIKKNMLPNNVIAYSLSDLQTVTGNFNMEHLVGEGSIGCVYKVQYADGKVMAIKRMESALIQRSNSENFMEMISNISRMRHPNITELIGYCIEHGHCLLIYQFLKNGSLHAFLHLSDDYSKPLTWNTRIRIALGTARAIEYLHEVCSPSSVHKNIKSANILLDSNLILTFGLRNINQIMGIGYKAPECSGPSGYTIKSDVYSFGVVMLELLTGRPPFNSSKTRDEQYLVNWAVPKLHDIDALDKMVDPALHGLYPPKSLSRFADVIALCVQPEPEFRPPMSEVVHALVRVIQSDNSVRTSMNKRTGDYSDCPYY